MNYDFSNGFHVNIIFSSSRRVFKKEIYINCKLAQVYKAFKLHHTLTKRVINSTKTTATIYNDEYCRFGFSQFFNEYNFKRLVYSGPVHTNINNTHREKLCFAQFTKRIYWNRSLADSDLFHMFTQSIKLYTFHCTDSIPEYRCLKKVIRQKDKK